MDGIHNFSDDLALIAIYAAFVAPAALTRISARTANLLNSVGLIAISAVLVWQSLERLDSAAPVRGAVPIIVGLAAAMGNWSVMRLLRDPAERNVTVRLAYLHNRADVLVSLAPVSAGLLMYAFGSVADAIVAIVVAIWFIGSNLGEIIASGAGLVWPAEMVCDHPAAR